MNCSSALRLTLLLALMTTLTACQSLRPFPATLKAVEQASPSPVALDIRDWRTSRGTRVLFVQSPSLPMLDVRLTFAAGSARDGALPGLASLTSTLIDEGADGLTVDDIARGFEDLGASMSTDSHRDMGLIELRTLTMPEYLDPALNLFLRVIAAPDFPGDALERVRQQYLVGLARQKQVPGPQLNDRVNEVVFGEHPYAHPPSGTEQSLVQISRDDLKAFYQRHYNAANGVIAMVGDLDEAAARALAERISAALPPGEAAPALPPVARAGWSTEEHLDFDASQTHITIAQQSIRRGHPDWVALYVGNEILGGGGFASILMEQVRQQRGFVYGISSSFSPMAAAGPFRISLQTSTDNAAEARELTLQLLRDFIEQGPTESQLRNAIDSITGSMAQGVAENDDIVGHLASLAFYNQPLDYLQQFDAEVRTMTVEKVRDAFQRNLDPDALAIISIGRQPPVAPAP